MRQYLDLCQRILDDGEYTKDRTGVGTIGIFGAMMQFDLRKGFPLLTTKKVLWDTVVDELLWFVRGGHNVNDPDAPKKIWDAWADENGELGRIYGVQWREWAYVTFDGDYPHFVRHRRVDQLQLAIDRVKNLPNSRRNIVSAWNVAEIEQAGVINFPPCHVMFQLRVNTDYAGVRRLDMAMFQRSCDMPVGVPFNIASYALLLALIANECCLEPGVFTHFLTDAHIYMNQVDTMKRQLAREPRDLPRLLIAEYDSPEDDMPLPIPGRRVVDIRREHIHLCNYNPHGFLKYDVAV